MTGQPETGQPETGRPEAEWPGTALPGTARPEPEREVEGRPAGIPRQSGPSRQESASVPQPPPLPPRPAPRPGGGLGAELRRTVLAGCTAFAARPLARHQAAVVRVGFALVFTLQLLREWPNRRVLYGDRSPWSQGLARDLLGETHAFTVLVWRDEGWWFEGCYLLAILAGVLMLLGWRTRFSSVLFLVAVLSVQNRDILVGDGGDNIVHLMAIYLAFTRCSEVWSLDARRRARGGGDGRPRIDAVGVLLWALCGALLTAAQLTGHLTWRGAGWPYVGWSVLFWLLWAVAALWWLLGRRWPDGEVRAVLDALATMLHHCAMTVIAAQVVLVYSTAGWYKVQGSRWQDGSALYYPLHLDYFTPWPGLSALLGGSAVLVFLFSYGTVLVQVAFPFTLVNRRVKNVLLAVMITEHLAIAVLLGLPIFSLAMVAADAVFLPTGALLRVAGWLRPVRPVRPVRSAAGRRRVAP
ncbi:HTTM domain-containing protein [Kitasatospora sp. NBC_01287]|uniref:HTTM domain-containing protein n=1 Tax=Kitasatospora sp. NBC_01287 TaxID=2903573 RepID=UPI002250142D|nr:HTTM domain-containing protein [Kitasatospora sp. NBC_01287]MCX4747716.1 HTTM domain-containing protein [Kitasatospora sp. NBC_01287]